MPLVPLSDIQDRAQVLSPEELTRIAVRVEDDGYVGIGTIEAKRRLLARFERAQQTAQAVEMLIAAGRRNLGMAHG